MINVSLNFLVINSLSNSPFFNPALSSYYSLSICRFSYFYQNLFRSTGFFNNHFICKKSEISFFLTTPIYFSNDNLIFEGENYTERQIFENESSTITLVDCNFHDITSDEKGGAIMINWHVDTEVQSTTFRNCFSNDEAAILFAGAISSDSYTWLVSPVVVKDCYCEGCSTSGNKFTVVDNWAEKYPSVLFHFWMGTKTTTIPSKVLDTSIVDCQPESNKRFGAFLHHHSNIFTVSSVNCTNHNKIGSSEILFSQAQKEQSNIIFLQAIGQSGHILFDITHIQSKDRITFTSSAIINSTIITDSNNQENEKSAVIHFSQASFQQTLLFVQCFFFNIDSNQPTIDPLLFTNNSVPIFFNCLTNVQSLADTSVQMTVYNPGSTSDSPTEELTSIPDTIPISSPTSITNTEEEQGNKKGGLDVYIIIIILMCLTIIAMCIAIAAARRYYHKLIQSEMIDDEIDTPLNSSETDL